MGSKCCTKEERTIRYVEDQRQSYSRLDVSDHELAVVDVEGRVVAVEEGASKTPGVLREVLSVRRLERCDADRHSDVLELSQSNNKDQYRIRLADESGKKAYK